MDDPKTKIEITTNCPACRVELKDKVDAGDYVLTCPACGYSGTATIAAPPEMPRQ